MKNYFPGLKSSDSFSEKRIRLVFWIMIALLFLAHLPFLNADPDNMVSLNTRGAWTDEGLYTAQLRDYINHGQLQLYNNNGFILTPVLQIILFPFLAVFGTDIIVARLVILMSSLAVLMLFSANRRLRLPSLIFLLMVVVQYHYFQFCHYSMGEIVAINMVLLSLCFIDRYDEYEANRWILPAVFFSFLAWGTKVQFIYVIVLVPATLLLKTIEMAVAGKKSCRSGIKTTALSVLYTALFLLFYLLVWYLPNREFYDYILNYETAERFKGTLPEILQVYRFNFRHLIWVKELWPVLLSMGLFFLAYVTTLLFNRKRIHFSAALIFAVLWLITEQHKVAMIYLPTRYFLSLIAAAGVVAALSASYLIRHRRSSIAIILPVIAAVFMWNAVNVYKSWQRRTFDIQAVNKYLEKSGPGEDKPVLGIWAYTLAAETKAPTIGIRNNYLNDKDPIRTYKPKLVITEFNQAESDSAWARQGIDLAAISDSVRRFKVWRYDLDFYWISDSGKYLSK